MPRNRQLIRVRQQTKSEAAARCKQARLVGELRSGLVTLFMTGYAGAEVLRLAALEGPHKRIQKRFTCTAYWPVQRMHSRRAGTIEMLAGFRSAP